MDPCDEIIQYVRNKATEYGYPGNDSCALGVLATMLEQERKAHKRYVDEVDNLENSDYLLEFISQEVRASTTETSEDRDELVEFLKTMIRKLERIEYDETPEEPIGDYNDASYELEKEVQLGWA